MKILFFCGSLEAGRDGVGDYTRRLADECASRGHACTVLALHDLYVGRVTDQTPDKVRHIRLPATEPWPGRLAWAAHQLQQIAPDWVSWQLVAYGFHSRGFLPAALLQYAPELRGPRCHVMLHELWLGLEAGATWRSRATGWLQRRGVLCLLGQLDPDCLHTSQAAYQLALRREGYASEVLGLFGNIPLTDNSPGREPPFARWLPAPARGEVGAPLVALTFGTLHPQWRPAATVSWLLATARRLARQPVLLALGRAGSHAPAILTAFRECGVQVGVAGELDPADVSRLLRAADLGIASHPWALIGKSGAAAAMLEHGLPVVVPRDDWRLRGAPAAPASAGDALLVRLAGLDPARTDRWLASGRTPASTLGQITGTWLQALELAPTSVPLLQP